MLSAEWVLEVSRRKWDIVIVLTVFRGRLRACFLDFNDGSGSGLLALVGFDPKVLSNTLSHGVQFCNETTRDEGYK